MLWKYFQNCMYSFRENWKINLTICYTSPHLNPSFVYNFTEIESTFPVPFWDYVTDCLWHRGMVSICLIWKGKHDWSSTKDFSLIDLIFLLYLLQSVRCNLFCQDNKFSFLKSISSFHTSVCPETSHSEFLLLYCDLISLIFKVFHEGNLRENFINFVMWRFACMV